MSQSTGATLSPEAAANAKISHPPGLYSLFFTEMWERFSYYGMRAMLVLYLVNQIGYQRPDALEIYAIFTGLVYLTPLLGGLLADKVLGHRKAILIGGVLMALGQFTLATSPSLLALGLGFLIIGNGFFKPNISTIVGSLYSDRDPRKDSAFTIFYMGINIGAFLAPLVCGSLRQSYGFSYGFMAAGVGMLLGVGWFLARQNTLGGAGYPPGRKEHKFITRDWIDILLYIVGAAIAVYVLIEGWTALGQSTRDNLKFGLGFVGMAALIYIIATNTKGSDEWSRVGVLLVLSLFNIFFFAGFEQAGGTFNLFADKNTDRMLFGHEIPADYFQSINAILIVILAPLMSIFWIRLGKWDPSIPVKFSLSLILLGLGFVVMFLGSEATQGGTQLVSPMWLVAVYFLHTVSELCLSPIGLSMVSKLSPPKITAVMMGFWFFCTAIANYMAGILENLLHTYEVNLFQFLIISSFASGLVLLALSPFLRRGMKGIS